MKVSINLCLFPFGSVQLSQVPISGVLEPIPQVGQALCDFIQHSLLELALEQLPLSRFRDMRPVGADWYTLEGGGADLNS